MTKKEAIVKYISEMNTEMLSLLLDDDKSYMDVPKETFIAGLDKVFNRLRNQEINEFSRVLKGHCGGSCNKGCGGYTFLTHDNQSLDLIVVEENSEINDLYTCTIFINDEKIEDKNEIYMSFYDDEKTDFIPSKRHEVLRKNIKNAFSEFNKFKNDVTDIEHFCNWNSHIQKLYKNINLAERFKLKFPKDIMDLVHKNSYIQELITSYPFAKKAMEEFNFLNSSNEKKLIEWVLKYEDNELTYGDYEKVNNWEQNNLILHALDKSIVIDCTKYAASLQFSELHPKHYWELFEKYKITSAQFKKAKALTKGLQYNLRTFLKIRNKYQQLGLFKTENKPLYFEYVIGEPDDTSQFIVLAGNELGINVRVEFIGSVHSFIDAKGVVQLKPYPELIGFELENKKANKFYTEEIGLDWKSKLQDKIMELFIDNQVDECPF